MTNSRSARTRSRARIVGALAAVTLAVSGVGLVANAATASDVASVPPPGNTTGDPAPPDDLGTDADLDALAEDCFDGDLLACDLLFLRSPVDSAYEEYGDTCGGRQEAGTEEYCALGADDVVAPDPTDPTSPGTPIPPGDLGDDPLLDQYAADCYAGDMEACDDLYWESPIDSAYEEYGDTCAGRATEPVMSCTDLDDPVPGSDLPADTGDVPVDTGDVPGGELPPPTLEPTGLGDDPELDALAEECYEGDMGACDELYDASPRGTEYQEYADTCAGRQPTGTGLYCETAFPGSGPLETTEAPATSAVPDTGDVPVDTGDVPGGELPPPTLEPTGLGDDPELDALAEECYDGSMAACDELYNTSPIGSDYEEYADTCAGRQPTGTGRYCEYSFPGTEEPTDTGAPDTSAPGTTVFVPSPPSTSTGPIVPLPSLPTPSTSTGPTPTVPPLPTGDVPTTEPGAPTTDPASGEIPPATVEPTGLGDDPELDALAEECFDGDMESCDQLWRDSDPGSTYREYGDTCAGRQPRGTAQWCVSTFPGTPPTTVVTTEPQVTAPAPGPGSPTVPPPGAEPTGLGSDPALDALAQACYDGDMASCDELFSEAPFNSPYQEYGDTCGGRQPTGTFTYCVAAFPAE